MKSEYKSGKSVGKNQTVPISVDDPRVSPSKIGQTKARMGAEIEIVGLDGKLLVMGGTSIAGASKPVVTTPPSFPPHVWPPGGNEPPKTYPGGSGPFIIVPTNPANVVAAWSGDDLVVTFDWDANNEYNVTITQFILEVTADGVTRRTPMNTFAPNKASTSQTATFTKTLNKLTFGLFRTKITSVCVLVADPLNNISQTICATSVGAYVLNLPVPVITLTGTTSGYSVGYTTPVSGPFDALDVWEIESVESTAPSVTFAADGITPTNYSRVYFDSLNPAQVPTANTNKRWAMARFSSEGGIYTLFCDPKVVTPISPVAADNEGPPDTTNVSVSGGIDATKQIGFNGYAVISWSAVRSILADGVTKTGIRGYRVKFWPVNPVTKEALTDSDYSYRDFPGAGTFPGTITGRLNELAVGATYKFAVATYDEYNNTSSNYVEAATSFSVPGTPFIAKTVDVKGYFSAGTGSDVGLFKFGYGIGSDPLNPQRGISFNDNNYWHITSNSTALLKVGGGDSNYIKWDGSDFLIDGNISARKGTFSGNVTIAGGGSLQSFITPPTVFSIDQVTYTSTTATYRTTAEHGYIIGDDVLISGLLPVGYNGKFKITARTVTTFTVANTTNVTATDYVGSVILITGTGFVLNKDGLAFNSSTIRDITTINAETGLFTTQSANIGGWQINSVTRPGAIYKTSISGKGNIILDSTNGYIAVSNSAIASSLAGINSPGNDLTHSVFWAGTTDPNATANPFRVTLGGKLYATEADITGTVSSIGALGRMTLDGTHGYISLKTGASGPTAYIVPRNDNIYITSPSATPPWNSDLTKGINSSGPVNGPYFSAGSSFKDYWNNVTQGVGIYTGEWDYFSGVTTKPFITTTTTGIQLSVTPSLGLILDGGTTATGDKLSPGINASTAQNPNPSMLFYTSNEPYSAAKPYSPSTKYGAWAAFTSYKIKLSADTYTFINIDGTPNQKQILMKSTENIGALFDSTGIMINIDADTFQEFRDNYIKLQATGTVHQTLNSDGIKIQSSANIWQLFDSTGIRLQSTNSVYQTFDSSSIVLTSGNTSNTTSDFSAYGGGSKIIINGSKVSITGIPRATTFDMSDYRTGIGEQGNYRNTPPMGYLPRQRMVIEDPVSGEAQLGLGIYYLDTSIANTTVPSQSTGVLGDITLVY